MSNCETNVLPSVQQEPARSWLVGTIGKSLVRAGRRSGNWAAETAQKFAALLADLLGPAVFLIYAMAAWNLCTSLGWQGNFLFATGPLSNWLVWLGLAILLNFASSILKRRTQSRE